MTMPTSALVIGAGDATGGAIARRFAREGFITCVARRNADKLEPLLQQIRDAGGTAHGFGSDARDEAQIALQSERQAEPDGVAVQRRDDGLAQREGGRVHGGGAEVGVLGRLEGGRATAEVRARAEGGSGAGQHDDAHRVVRVAAAVRVAELLAHAAAEGVALLGTVQLDHGDAVLELEADVLVAHPPLSGPGSISSTARPWMRPARREKKSSRRICQPYFARSAA